jgi:hypothetical protein
MVVMLHMVRHSVQHRNRRVDGSVENARIRQVAAAVPAR